MAFEWCWKVVAHQSCASRNREGAQIIVGLKLQCPAHTLPNGITIILLEQDWRACRLRKMFLGGDVSAARRIRSHDDWLSMAAFVVEFSMGKAML